MRRRKRFLYGRNGTDALSMATSLLACGLLLMAMLVGQRIGSVLWLMALICLGCSYFRIFSRNISRRQQENQRFLRLIKPLSDRRARFIQRRKQKNLYCFFKCPQCATVLRVPKGKGRIRITCRCCGHVFERNS